MLATFALVTIERPVMPDEVLKLSEVASLLKVAEKTVYTMAQRSEIPKAAAFNAVDRFRDPSTTTHRPLQFLRRLFEATGLGAPEIQRFEVSYLAPEFVARSFPLNDDRAGLLAMIEASVDGDTMDLSACRSPEGVRFAFRSAVLSAVKPG